MFILVTVIERMWLADDNFYFNIDFEAITAYSTPPSAAMVFSKD